MDILVCIKQVPDTSKVEVDPVTGVLKRDGVDSKMNPYDLYALETALKMKCHSKTHSAQRCSAIRQPGVNAFLWQLRFEIAALRQQGALKPISRTALRLASRAQSISSV